MSLKKHALEYPKPSISAATNSSILDLKIASKVLNFSKYGISE